ncbi:MAG: LysM peptidoglycan-binding domain-containing M23 family metallopeptidase [Alphaproteobacteria bacterium]|nr:LysM peptidoglycan-binding domain-containing M23 family metallopeptidase [Alphaproteobacteria bacterium]
MKKFLLGISILSLSACGTQKPAPLNVYGVTKGAGSVGVHTVLPGDTIYKIAENYHLPMREIITLNKIEAPYVLNTGYRVKLPPPNEYRVRKGDSVYSIARMYETSVNRLVELNNLQPPYVVKRGQKLRLPTPTLKAQQQQAMAQRAVYDEPIASARVAPVEREGVVTSSAAKTPDTYPPQPEAKATVQQASTARAKIPNQTPKLSGNGKFMQPVNGQIVSSFGPKADGLHNDGINIKAVRGTAVRAAENGVVVYTGDELKSYGNLILVRHEGGMMSAYAHLDKTLVKRGDTITRGQSIGTVGSTGQVDSPQLHFEIRKGSTPVNPNQYL